MTDEYIARERALSLAHADNRDIILPAEEVIELAEKYLAFLMPEKARYWTDAGAMSLRPLSHGGIAG